MLVAVISDIHSNPFALRTVLRDAERIGVDEIWLNGDAFGYYPWPVETFELLETTRPLAVLGNHDGWIVHPEVAPANVAGEIARQNSRQLASHCPAALRWLASLPAIRQFQRDGWDVTLAHGTPEDPVDGRYYPDNRKAYDWLPRADQVLILGQTHYPILRGDGPNGLLLNPGSVGQPRDGNPMPSWATLDLATGAAELRRTVYDHRDVIARLRARRWNEQLTLALDRRRQGSA